MDKTSTLDTAALRGMALDHLWMPFQPARPYANEGGPLIMVSAEGCWMTDSDGRRFLDGVSALEAAVAGHRRADLARVAYDQMIELEFLDVFRYASPPAVRLAARLAEITPGDLSRVHFTPGGSEAVETAIKIAKQYQRLTGHGGRYKLITRAGAYHGCTFGAMAVDGDYFGTENELYGPLLPITVVAPAPDALRCPRCQEAGRRACNQACLEDVERIIETEGPETIAAFVLDPCSTASAVAVPPDGYLPALREMCRKHGILFVLDEIITGFGRTGRLFAAEHWGLEPDIMTVSKGLSSGYMPIGAAIASERIAAVFEGEEGRLSHGQTYGAHPVACAVALANIDLIERENLAGRAAERGKELLAGLRSLTTHRSYVDARGLWLLCGLEFATASAAESPAADPRGAGYLLRTICRDLGLITLTLHPGNVLFLAPPLTISAEEVDLLTGIVDRALTVYEERYL
jgi:adenosylmethionine-8-amino-7-oxononanoate aminotransferase